MPMQIWSLNLKKCWASKLCLFAVICVFVCSGKTLNASVPPVEVIKSDLKKRSFVKAASKTRGDFARMLGDWEASYGPDAVEPLLKIAFDVKVADSERYIALMGASKLGGSLPSINSRVLPLLKDRSWMIRSGILRVLSALNDPSAAKSVLPLLKDPALVVRVEAVNTIVKLKPKGASDALLAVLEDKSNYSRGKPLWVPKWAIAGLVQLKARSAAPKLSALMKNMEEGELKSQAALALESFKN